MLQSCHRSYLGYSRNKMLNLICVAALWFPLLECSQTFAPSLIAAGPAIRRTGCRYPQDLMPRLRRRRSRPEGSTKSARATEEGEWEGRLVELDVVEYRNEEDGSLQLASYIGDGKLQPLLTRRNSGPNLFFHDEEAQPVPVSGGSCRIVRVLHEVYFSQRIVEDRVKNPHGEEAEDCFLLEGKLDPTTVIRVDSSQS